MRPPPQPLPRSVRSKIAGLAVAIGVFGLSFGVLAVTAGLSPLVACAMSLLVLAGGSQFAAVGVVAAGGSPVAAVVSGALLNTRFVPFGLALAPLLEGGLLRRAVASHILVDESAALAIAEGRHGRASPDRVFWLTGITVLVTWNVGTALGAFAGGLIGDPEALGLDVAFPAGFLALLAPLLDTRRARVSALAGVAIAIVLVPTAPPGVPVLAATLGAALALLVPEDAGGTR